MIVCFFHTLVMRQTCVDGAKIRQALTFCEILKSEQWYIDLGERFKMRSQLLTSFLFPSSLFCCTQWLLIEPKTDVRKCACFSTSSTACSEYVSPAFQPAKRIVCPRFRGVRTGGRGSERMGRSRQTDIEEVRRFPRCQARRALQRPHTGLNSSHLSCVPPSAAHNRLNNPTSKLLRLPSRVVLCSRVFEMDYLNVFEDFFKRS